MITTTNFAVKHSEIDHMGIVHHSNYPKWFEAGRKNYLKEAGISKSKLRLQGFFLPLTELKCQFKIPAKYKDDIMVSTCITDMSCVKIKFQYSVLNQKSGKVLAKGNSMHAWTNRNIHPINIKKESPEIYTLLKQFIQPTE